MLSTSINRRKEAQGDGGLTKWRAVVDSERGKERREMAREHS